MLLFCRDHADEFERPYQVAAITIRYTVSHALPLRALNGYGDIGAAARLSRRYELHPDLSHCSRPGLLSLRWSPGPDF